MGPCQSSECWLQLRGRDHFEDTHCPTAITQPRAGTFPEMTTRPWSSHIFLALGILTFLILVPRTFRGLGKEEVPEQRGPPSPATGNRWGRTGVGRAKARAVNHRRKQPPELTGACEDLNMPLSSSLYHMGISGTAWAKRPYTPIFQS